MKAKNKNQSGSITASLLERIVKRDLENFNHNFPNAIVGSKPLAQPGLYQDPGNGYNKNLTYPQV
jgi:hypothetical protein